MHNCRRYRGTCMCPCHTHRCVFKHACLLHNGTHMRNCQEHSCAQMHGCALNRSASNACLFSPFGCPRTWMYHLQLHNHSRESFNRPYTGGPNLTKSSCTTIHTTLPKNKILITMKEDTTTNLALADPELAGSIS
jgi:hypothetical protein